VCTLILLHRMFADAPVVVAANRDEGLERPSAPPALRTDGPVPVLAPRDLAEGGTWLGVNAAGVFSGITNRFGAGRDAARRSRGLLVLDALGATTARVGAGAAAAHGAGAHNPFHLVVADAREAYLVIDDGARVTVEALRPGAHVLTERSRDAGVTAREPLVREQLGALGAAAGAHARERALGRLLATHTDDGFDSVCVHVPALGYGTRSSALLSAGGAAPPRWLFADGAPCTTAYADLSPRLAELLATGVGGGREQTLG
jgi:uncharacterized protein with NRDE domain